MSDERSVVSYPRDAVLTEQQLSAAISVSVRTMKRHDYYDLPRTYLGGSPRFVWGQVIDTMTERAALRDHVRKVA